MGLHYINRFLIAIGITFSVFTAGNASEAKSTVRVVKGQVSDYFITETENRNVTGIVYDENGKPLEGATVMFFASPMHSNTDENGRYNIKGAYNDSVL